MNYLHLGFFAYFFISIRIINSIIVNEKDLLIRSLYYSQCTRTTNSEIVDLSNQITEQIGENFINTSVTKCLTMKNNRIKNISNSAFDKLSNLVLLNLENNELEEKNINFTSKLGNLKSLILNNAYKKDEHNENEFFVEISSPKLGVLFLGNNSMKKLNIKAAFLTFLNLDNNRLTEIPIMKNAQNLTTLLMNYNQIETCNLENLQNVPNLKVLSLAFNKIQNLETNCFGSVINLRNLDLRGNNLKEILYSSFQSLTHLQELILANNEITLFDGQIIDVNKQLKNLNLNYNKLSTVPQVKNVSDLENLKLIGNDIKSLSSNDFWAFSKLKNLYLQCNNITNVTSESFSNFKNLRLHFLNTDEEYCQK